MSRVRQFYAGQNIFITGGTGFLGKILIEKLLRGCPEIGNIYLLIRAKKGKRPEERIEALFVDSLFDVLRNDYPNFSNKVIGVVGDIAEERLGLSSTDYARLVNEISIIFHCAATIRFDEKLDKAVAVNVNSVKSIVDIAKECKNLKVGIYVSTAFSYCIQKSIDEKLYPPPMSHGEVNELVKDAGNNDWSDLDWENFTNTVLGKWANTYIFTKAIGEGVVAEFAKELPFAVFRPSIVSPTHDEPVPGWLCGLAGISGLAYVYGLGILHVLILDRHIKAEIVPVDFVCNALITSAWETAITERRPHQDIPVYNYVTRKENPLTWKQFLDKTVTYGHLFPSNAANYYMFLISTKSERLFIVLNFLLHLLPAFIIDNVARLFGRQLRLYELAKKMGDVVYTMKFGFNHELDFEDKRVVNLWNRITPEDRRLFPFDMRRVDWDEHSLKTVKGIRKYIAGEPDGTEEEAKRRHFYLYIIHTAVRLTFWISVLWIIWKVFLGPSLSFAQTLFS